MSQYQQDFKPPVSHQDLPGREGDLPVEAIHDKLPTADGGWQPYKAAGKLEGKKALITGGDSGIGRAITILYAMEGADSFIVYLPEEEEDAQETKRQVEKHGRKCFLMSTDLRKQENCQKVVETALKELGQVNILVNNAGVAGLEDSFENWQKTIETDLIAIMRLTDLCLPHISSGAGKGIGALINICSVAGKSSTSGESYCAAKHGVLGFSHSIFEKVRDQEIKVSCICPGFVNTSMTKGVSDKENMIQPEAIAETALFCIKFPSSGCVTEIEIRPQHTVHTQEE